MWSFGICLKTLRYIYKSITWQFSVHRLKILFYSVILLVPLVALSDFISKSDIIVSSSVSLKLEFVLETKKVWKPTSVYNNRCFTCTKWNIKKDFNLDVHTVLKSDLTDTAMLISELTRFDSFYFFPRNSSCFYYVGRQTKSSDCNFCPSWNLL